MRLDFDLAGKRKEVLSVLAGQVGDGAYDPLAPQQLVWHGRDVAHVNAAEHHRASLAHASQGRRHEPADGCENDGRLERDWGWLIRAAGPGAAETSRESFCVDITRAGEGIHGTPLELCDLCDDVRGGSETIDADGACGASHA